ncbi:hypothetical protein K0M31_008423, partial [Melipona bicolor]
MMMANLPPVMLPPLTDYGMLTPTLGIKAMGDIEGMKTIKLKVGGAKYVLSNISEMIKNTIFVYVDEISAMGDIEGMKTIKLKVGGAKCILSNISEMIKHTIF